MLYKNLQYNHVAPRGYRNHFVMLKKHIQEVISPRKLGDMLASTIQISNNNPTNTPATHARPGQRRPETQTHTHVYGLMPQTPNSMPNNPHQPPDVTFHAEAVLTQPGISESLSSTIPLVNTTIRNRSNVCCRGVCSLERR